jgi:two-component sensor histidine kinase
VVRVPEGRFVTPAAAAHEPDAERDPPAAGHTAEVEALNDRLQVAIRESNHRVLNNLQIIAALIDMQLMEQPEQVPATELHRLSAQIHTLAAVHTTLTRRLKETAPPPTDQVSARAVLERLLTNLQAGAGSDQIVARMDDVLLSCRHATALGMVATELCSNALRHGGAPIELTLAAQGGSVVLEVTDSGPAFPADFDPEQLQTTGMQLVLSLVRRDLRGEIRFATRPQGGAQVTVIFPLQTY